MDHSEDDRDAMRVQVASAMADIDRAGWDQCANPQGGAADPSGEFSYNPFISWDFLEALEASGTVSARTGWLPRHLVLEGPDGHPAGVVPCYLKSHSQGEYVFDYGWADAYERAGGHYYPKLQVSVPFSPVPGRRILVGAGEGVEMRRRALAAALAELASRHEASSVHVTFLSEPEWKTLGDIGYLQRTDQQFHWVDQDFGSFDGFLDSLASRKRKAVRKERAKALENNITIEWVTGSDITEEHWDIFLEFYLDTGSRKWGRPYLNRTFFSLIGERMADRILLIMARRNGRYIAGALNLIGSDTLYGRNWGCIEHHDCLHFEVCYYQAIEFALAKGLTRVEAGAQGAHKLARGYLPATTFSAHFILDPNFRSAVDDFLQQERQHVAWEQEANAEHAPFKKSG
ncbi:MAG TPA: GNAT family N-acetyltransferase [Afifellaceae bacterium]|nr:GNAT family N-acetyltransferase [Afifellaceae bacterium]